jgi:hypothetical protein
MFDIDKNRRADHDGHSRAQNQAGIFLPQERHLVGADVFVNFAENISHCHGPCGLVQAGLARRAGKIEQKAGFLRKLA